MNLNDFKLYALNATAMFISFTDVEQALKIILLIISIVYTTLKVIELNKQKKK